MAAIGKIRQQSGLLIALIGIAMLLFLLSDLFSSGTSFFTQEDQIVGSIAGKEISLQEYEIKVQEAIDQQFGVEGADEMTRERVRDRIWQEMVRERVVTKELNRLGLGVSQEELLDQVKNIKPNSVLYQYFTDPNTGQIIEQFKDEQTGGLSSQRVMQAIQNLLNSENSKDWLPIERAIEQDVIMEKYLNMITKGMVVSSVEASQIGKENQATVNFDYTVKEFSAIPNEEAQPTDEELKTYFNEHRNEDRFKQEEESRNVRLALFDLTPTDEDIKMLEQELIDLKPKFSADSNDTAFVGENADNRPDELIRYVAKDEVPAPLKDTINETPIGSVFGPINMGDRMVLVKLSDIKEEPDSVRASHILINIQDGDTAKISAAKTKLDSLKTVAAEENNFAALATEFSEDAGSAVNGGDLEWFTRGRMVPSFEKACFNGKVDEMVMVESQFGVHLIKITDQTEPQPKYLISYVDRIIEPSKSTSDNIYKKASKYALSLSGATSIEDVPESGMSFEPHEGVQLTDDNIGQIQNSKEIIRWIYDSEEGDVSSPFETERFFVVAGLEGINPEGVMEFERAQPLIYGEVMNKKKSEQIISMLGSYTSLEQASQALGSEIKSAENVNFAQGSLPGGLGREMKVLGTAFSLEEGGLSKPINGSRGVFVIRVSSKTDAGEVDIAATKRKESSNISTRVNSKVFQSLEKAAGVEDKRAKYY